MPCLAMRLRAMARSLGLLFFLCMLPAFVQAQVHNVTVSTYVVGNDRGGALEPRLREVARLRASGRPVEITGSICYSTCTLFLGLPNACVSPRTVFGFHGPSSYGRHLDPKTFNRASKVIASHYPQALAQWYMREGRYSLRQVHKIRGSALIRMGVRAC